MKKIALILFVLFAPLCFCSCKNVSKRTDEAAFSAQSQGINVSSCNRTAYVVKALSEYPEYGGFKKYLEIGVDYIISNATAQEIETIDKLADILALAISNNIDLSQKELEEPDYIGECILELDGAMFDIWYRCRK